MASSDSSSDDKAPALLRFNGLGEEFVANLEQVVRQVLPAPLLDCYFEQLPALPDWDSQLTLSRCLHLLVELPLRLLNGDDVENIVVNHPSSTAVDGSIISHDSDAQDEVPFALKSLKSSAQERTANDDTAPAGAATDPHTQDRTDDQYPVTSEWTNSVPQADAGSIEVFYAMDSDLRERMVHLATQGAAYNRGFIEKSLVHDLMTAFGVREGVALAALRHAIRITVGWQDEARGLPRPVAHGPEEARPAPAGSAPPTAQRTASAPCGAGRATAATPSDPCTGALLWGRGRGRGRGARGRGRGTTAAKKMPPCASRLPIGGGLLGHMAAKDP